MGGPTLVLGSGGVTGIAWITGLLAGLEAAGLDLCRARSLLGTSAGSTVAAQVSSGASIHMLYERQIAGLPSEPSRNVSALTSTYLLWQFFSSTCEIAARRIGHASRDADVGAVIDRRRVIEARLPCHDWPDEVDLRIVMVDAATGAARVVTRKDGLELVDVVAASCAVPMVWPQVPLEGRTYLDGGMRSALNLDLAPGDGPVIALAPITTALRRWGSVRAQRSKLAPRRVHLVTPSASVRAVQGWNALDTSVVPATARAGFEQATRELPRLLDFLAGPARPALQLALPGSP